MKVDWENNYHRFFILLAVCSTAFLIWDLIVPNELNVVAYPDDHDYFGEATHYTMNKWSIYYFYIAGLILTALPKSFKPVFIIFACFPILGSIFYLLLGHIAV